MVKGHNGFWPTYAHSKAQAEVRVLKINNKSTRVTTVLEAAAYVGQMLLYFLYWESKLKLFWKGSLETLILSSKNDLTSWDKITNN